MTHRSLRSTAWQPKHGDDITIFSTQFWNHVITVLQTNGCKLKRASGVPPHVWIQFQGIQSHLLTSIYHGLKLKYTPLKFNIMEPENQHLETEIPFALDIHHFQLPAAKLWGCKSFKRWMTFFHETSPELPQVHGFYPLNRPWCEKTWRWKGKPWGNIEILNFLVEKKKT